VLMTLSAWSTQAAWTDRRV